MKLSIIIPVYNEAKYIAKVIDALHEVNFPCETEIVVIDDCSIDDSWQIINSINNKKSNLVIHQLGQNSGKGAAVRAGIKLASGTHIIVQDADLETDPNDICRLLQPILGGKADVVYGSRFHSNSNQVRKTYHYLGNKFLTFLSNLASGIYLTDMETCYKLVPAKILKSIDLTSNRFGFEPELTAKLAKLGCRIEEYPISYYPRTYRQGKKITWKDGIAAIWYILKYNLFSGTRKMQHICEENRAKA